MNLAEEVYMILFEIWLYFDKYNKDAYKKIYDDLGNLYQIRYDILDLLRQYRSGDIETREWDEEIEEEIEENVEILKNQL